MYPYSYPTICALPHFSNLYPDPFLVPIPKPILNLNLSRLPPPPLNSYVIVYFPNILIPEYEKWFPDKPQIWDTIPVFKKQGLKYFYTAINIPVLVYKAVKIQKSQGINFGPVKDWQNFVINIPIKYIRSQLGMELVKFSRKNTKE